MKNDEKQEFLKKDMRSKIPFAHLRGKVPVQDSIVFYPKLARCVVDVFLLITLFGLMALS